MKPALFSVLCEIKEKTVLSLRNLNDEVLTLIIHIIYYSVKTTIIVLENIVILVLLLEIILEGVPKFQLSFSETNHLFTANFGSQNRLLLI